MVIPAIPPANLVFIQASLAFRGLELGFDRPAPGSDLTQRQQRRVGRSVGQKVFEFASIQIPTRNQPTRASGHRIPTFPAALGDKLIASWSLGALGDCQNVPAFGG